MHFSRRSFLLGTAAGAVSPLLSPRLGHAAPGGLRLGACDWSLRTPGPEAFALGRELGLDGIEVAAGPEAEVLNIAKPETQAACRAAASATGLAIPSLALTLLNDFPFATDPRVPAWLEQTIAAAQALEAKTILVAFFVKGDLLDEAGALKAKDMDATVERLKAAALIAAKAGVTLGLENYLSARDNLALLERIQSDAVRVYYDVCNSTNKGYQVPEELRMLGDRVRQVHLKDNKSLLGQGDVNMSAVHEALESISYEGWLLLETPVVDKDLKGSFRKNAQYARGLFQI